MHLKGSVDVTVLYKTTQSAKEPIMNESAIRSLYLCVVSHLKKKLSSMQPRRFKNNYVNRLLFNYSSVVTLIAPFVLEKKCSKLAKNSIFASDLGLCAACHDGILDFTSTCTSYPQVLDSCVIRNQSAEYRFTPKSLFIEQIQPSAERHRCSIT